MTPAKHGYRGSGHHASKLTEEQVREIRRRYEAPLGTETLGSLACDYGVSAVMVWKIVTGSSWKHLLGGAYDHDPDQG